MQKRTYSELILLPTFAERFHYLKMNSEIGISTFGSRRFLNQEFYSSEEWRMTRNHIITRDRGRDMGLLGYDISGPIVIHHMNPITVSDIEYSTDALFDPENLICVSPTTHRAIHYGNDDLLIVDYVERTPNDTCPWRNRR